MVTGALAVKMNGGAPGVPRSKLEGRRSAGGGASGSTPSAAEGRRSAGAAACPGGPGGLGGVSGISVGASGGGWAGGRSDGDDGLNDLDGVVASLSSSDWAARIQGVTSLCELATDHGEALCARGGRLLTVFDALTPRLTDSNSKVNVVALQALQQMVPALREGLPSVVSTLVPALATSLASSNAQVRSITPGVLETLITDVDHGALIQPFANCVLYSPPKARPMMVDKLRELATSVYAAKPQLVVKHAVPTAFRLLEDNRADLRAGTVQLIRVLHVLLGPSLFEHAHKTPSAVQTRLQELVQTL